MNTPTDNAWLDDVLNSLVNEVEWCVNPAAGAISVNREKEQTAQAQAKQAILTHIDTVCREARIKELEWVRGAGNDINYLDMDIVDRIAELVAQGEAPTPPLNPNKDTESTMCVHYDEGSCNKCKDTYGVPLWAVDIEKEQP